MKTTWSGRVEEPGLPYSQGPEKHAHRRLGVAHRRSAPIAGPGYDAL
jgi:hypothetical protein